MNRTHQGINGKTPVASLTYLPTSAEETKLEAIPVMNGLLSYIQKNSVKASLSFFKAFNERLICHAFFKLLSNVHGYFLPTLSNIITYCRIKK